MRDLENAIRDLVVANRILGREDVVDAYGHVSIRHPSDPERYFLSCSRSPALVERADIMEFHLDGTPVEPDDRPPYLERFIHGAAYEARPDVNAVVHSHAEDTLPFGIAPTPLQAVIHSAGSLGENVPVWDIADSFGDDTNMLVIDMEQGRDLARALSGEARVVLMRGHGFAAAAPTLHDVVRLSVYLPKNARVQMKAAQLGGFKPLSPGECAGRRAARADVPESYRAWEYWAHRAGCRDML